MNKMRELYEKVAADSTLQEKFNGVLFDAKKAGDAAVNKKLIDFAKEAGFDVTVEEMHSFFQALSEKQEGELSDAELDSVAGGKGRVGVLASIFTFGVGCGIISAIAQATADSCKALMDSDDAKTW